MPARPRSPTRRRSSAALTPDRRSSTSRSTPSAWGSRARLRSSRASGRTRSWPQRSGSDSPCASGGTPSRCARAAPRSSSARCGAASRTRRSTPYRAFFQATRTGRDPDVLADGRAGGRRGPAGDRRATGAGRTCHPRLPFADWDACRPALDRLGAVLVAGCRDAVAARQLGFVPTHGVPAALEMARGLGGGRPRDRLPALATLLPAPRRYG